MKARGLLAAGLAMGVVACGGGGRRAGEAARDEASTATAPAAQSEGFRSTLRSRIHSDLPEFTFTLIGSVGSEPAGGRPTARIEIRRDAEARPSQTIDALEVEAAGPDRAPALEAIDMNFDGYADLRVPQFLPAGPNVPYLNWLFEPASGRFLRSAELDAMTSPVFDGEARQIRSEWRDGATRYGTNLYGIVEGRPVLVRKTVKEYTQPGMYTLTVSEFVGGEWKVVDRRVVRE